MKMVGLNWLRVWWALKFHGLNAKSFDKSPINGTLFNNLFA
jgi:hypothetical protein